MARFFIRRGTEYQMTKEIVIKRSDGGLDFKLPSTVDPDIVDVIREAVNMPPDPDGCDIHRAHIFRSTLQSVMGMISIGRPAEEQRKRLKESARRKIAKYSETDPKSGEKVALFLREKLGSILD